MFPGRSLTVPTRRQKGRAPPVISLMNNLHLDSNVHLLRPLLPATVQPSSDGKHLQGKQKAPRRTQRSQYQLSGEIGEPRTLETLATTPHHTSRINLNEADLDIRDS